MQNPDLSKDILSLEELASFLGLSKKAIYNRRSAGLSLPKAVKPPHMRGVFYLREDVLEWMKSNRER